MASLSYNLSPTIRDNLSAIENLRSQILTFVLPPKAELRFVWEATIQRIFWSLSFTNNKISKSEMVKLIAHPPKKRLNDQQKEVTSYKEALDFIKNQWYVNPKPVLPSTLLKLYDIACKPLYGSTIRHFQNNLSEVSKFTEYLLTSNEHPVLKAGIAQIQIRTISPFIDGSGRIGRLASYLYLYKEGYNFRDLVVLDEFPRRDLATFKVATQSAEKIGNMTYWLEYFTHACVTQLNEALQTIKNERFKTDVPASFWKINDRQRKILNMLDVPGEYMTNRKVQKTFNISQITASRDLAKLTNLGLLLSHGSGRSVSYSKI
jgi:hypothetical protein